MVFLKKLERIRNRVLETVPKSVVGHYVKAYGGKSRVSAIKAKCLDCCCDVRAEISDCRSYSCPLWDYRPYQKNIIVKLDN